MKKLVLILGILIGMMSAQAQTLATFECANKSYVNVYGWTEITSASEQMQIGNISVEFVAEEARMTHETSITNHITKSPTRTSAEGQVVKGKLYQNGTVIGIARFAVVGTSMAGTADIGKDTYQFRPDKDGSYAWELNAPFKCGTEDVDHDCELEHPAHIHGAKENHQKDEFLSIPARNPTDCTTESIQDVAFITNDLMTANGNDLNVILAQIAISDSWATDIMEDSGFPDIAFFQESVHVVDFSESGTTAGNLQVFNDSLYGSGIIANTMQGATSSVTVLYSIGGGGAIGAAVVSVYPMPSGEYYLSVLGDNGGIGNHTKMHEYGHSLWGGEHEDITPNPVLYRRAYLGTDGSWGNYATVMAQGNFGGGIRVYRFSDDDPTAGWYSEVFNYTFSPVGNADRDMCRRITEEWNRPGIVQVVDLTPATPTISADGSTTFCDGGSVTLSVDTPESGVDYIWSDGSTANSITVTVAGSYSCYGQSSSTCTGGTSNVIVVTVNSLPTPTITGDLSFCDGGSTVLDAGSGYSTYLWDTGATTQTITVGTAGTYSVTVTNANGCEGDDSVVVTVNALPTANAGNDITVGEGDDFQLNGSGDGTPEWTPHTGLSDPYVWNPTGTATATTQYTLITTSSAGCQNSDYMTVIVTGGDLSVEAFVNKYHFTVLEDVFLSCTVSGGTGSNTFDWTVSPGGITSTQQNFSFTSTIIGHYVATVIVNDGNETVSATVEFDIHPTWFNFLVDPVSGTTDDEYLFTSEIGKEANDPRTIDYHRIEFGDGQFYEGVGTIIEVSHTYEVAGTYDIEIYYEMSDGSSRDTTFLSLIGVITDVNEKDINEIKIYPNPTSGNLFINAGKSVERLSIINGFGSEVFHQENLGEMTQVSLSSLPSGLYFVRILSDGVLTTHKVVKR
jgi:hypothetical protein